MDKPIYFDNNATTPVKGQVFMEMIPFLTYNYGNPSSNYGIGIQAHRALEDARTSIAKTLCVPNPDGIIFTGSGSEADNMAIKGVATHYRDKKKIIITTSIEHHAVLNSMESLKKQGFSIIYIKPEANGRINPDNMKFIVSSYQKDVCLVSMMAANNETGVLQPVDEIGEFLREKNIVFHVDCVQSVGPYGLPKYGDLIAMSGHKVNAPKGIGALYIRPDFKERFGFDIPPLIDGGKQEHGLRGGTENVAYIVGYAKALELYRAKAGTYAITTKNLSDKLRKFISENIEGAKFNTWEDTPHLPNTLNVSIPGIDGAALQEYLGMKNICISTGSACNTGSSNPSHVLKAQGLSDEDAFASIRISFGSQNTEKELEIFEKALIEGVDLLRKVSGYYEKNRKDVE